MIDYGTKFYSLDNDGKSTYSHKKECILYKIIHNVAVFHDHLVQSSSVKQSGMVV